MPTPILKIPIDDSAFQRYLEAFKKYQGSVEAQPEIWAGINEGIQSTVAAGAALAATISEQHAETAKLAAEEEKREKAINEAAKRRRQEANDAKKAEEGAAKRRKEAIGQVREFSRTVADVALTVGKYALGGGLVAGALSLWGLDSIFRGAADERRTATSLGVSPSAHQGASVYLSRYGDVNAGMENVANAQADPSQWGILQRMGLNRNEKTSDLYFDALRRARSMFKADHGNLALAKAHGYLDLFGADQLRSSAADTDQVFNRNLSNARRYQGLSDDTGQKWQDFMAKVDEAGMTIKNALADKLQNLDSSGALSNIVTAFKEMAVGGITALGNFFSDKEVQESLKSFSKYLGSSEFTENVKEFAGGVAEMAREIKTALEILGLVSQSPAEKTKENTKRDAIKNESDKNWRYFKSLPGKLWDDVVHGVTGLPVNGGHITSGFGMRNHPILGVNRMHKGIDFGAPMGAAVYATEDGTVMFAGGRGGLGNYIKIGNAGGEGSGYGHLSKILVRAGQGVHKGQLIGKVGSTGLSTGPHLHYEHYEHGRAVDPMTSLHAALAHAHQAAKRVKNPRVDLHVKVSIPTGSSTATNVNAAVAG